MSRFVQANPTTDAYWRAIILFGKNSASYKFALGKTLLELARQEKTFVTLEELAEPYARHLVEHLRRMDRQGTSTSSKFLKSCRQFASGELSKDRLLERTARSGFVNVIEAFHNVNQSEIPTRFFSDERTTRGGIALTDALLALKDDFQYRNLSDEVEARWRLVETAWSLNLSPNLLVARYDPSEEQLYVVSEDARRVDVTSCRSALNGYQKGRCFYCLSEISIDGDEGDTACEVDHLFPHVLIGPGVAVGINLDGVWNLVLSCRRCNRGEGGKSARVPYVRPYLERLARRNDYLIESHHPLRETLIAQTGRTRDERTAFLNRVDAFAITHLIHRWRPSVEGPPVF